MSTTASSYIQAINENFPYAGQNNDSQGFRDNFTNIKAALSATNIDLVNLEISAMKQFENNDFGGYELKNANLVNSTVNIAAMTTSTGAAKLDYTKASFWPITLVISGINTVTLENLPEGQRSGSMVVSMTTSSLYTQVLFTATTGTVISLGPQQQPFELTEPTPYLFEIWNDYSGNVPYVYVKKLNEVIADNTFENPSLSFVAAEGNTVSINNSLKLGNLTFTTGTINGSLGATVVTDGTNYGNLALVPNRVSTIITSQPTFPAGGTSTQIAVLDSTGIQPGAKFYFLGTTTQYTVANVGANNVINIAGVASASVSKPNDPITFVNPQFTTQAKVMVLSDVKALDDFGSVVSGSTSYNLKGTIYADQNHLQVTFADPDGMNPNTFSVSKAVAITGTNTSTDLVTVGYVNDVMPEHSIIMWYGSQYDLYPNNPNSAWVLCNGQVAPNGVTTPNMSNQFVVGATSDAAGPGPNGTVPATNITSVQTITGGSVSSSLVAHTHGASANTYAVYDPGHQHLGVGANVIINSVPQPNGPYVGPNGSPNGPNGNQNWGFTEGTKASAAEWWTSKEYTFADHYGATPQNGGVKLSTTVSIDSSGGEDGSYANIPPYTALYYIYKWVGPSA